MLMSPWTMCKLRVSVSTFYHKFSYSSYIERWIYFWCTDNIHHPLCYYFHCRCPWHPRCLILMNLIQLLCFWSQWLHQISVIIFALTTISTNPVTKIIVSSHLIHLLPPFDIVVTFDFLHLMCVLSLQSPFLQLLFFLGLWYTTNITILLFCSCWFNIIVGTLCFFPKLIIILSI